MSFLSATPEQLSRSSATIDSVFPWQFNVSVPEFGFEIIVIVTMNLSRNKHPCIILDAPYFFHAVPIKFNAAYPKVCPHIAVSVLVKRTRESRDHPTHSPFCDTTIRSLYTGRTFYPDPNREGTYRHFLIQVRRKLSQHSLSGKELWWRLAQYGLKNADLIEDGSFP